MGVEYVSIQWNRQKKLYDVVLVSGVAAFLVVFSGLTKLMFPRVTDEIMLIRAFGAGAFLLLHIILCIGPLCRLNSRFLPLLYNRRHAGVTCFLLGLIHAVLVVITYHAGSDANPILSIFISGKFGGTAGTVPFQLFGFFALFILFLMAAGVAHAGVCRVRVVGVACGVWSVAGRGQSGLRRCDSNRAGNGAGLAHHSRTEGNGSR